LHAAGYHADGRSVLDRVVSSSTPTISALRYARQRSASSASRVSRVSQATLALADRALIVAMPTTPGLSDESDLPYAAREAAIVADSVPGSLVLTEPAGADVRHRLPEFTVAHFACHGYSSPMDPSMSLLLLRDFATRPFNVNALAPVALDHARLAYLSACETALGSAPALLDESIHLASAFQLAGYPHVIGTLWPVLDDAALHVASAFYSALRGGSDVIDVAEVVDGSGALDGSDVLQESRVLDTDRAAVALHHAVRAFRDDRQLHALPSLWAAYLHAGA
jgi:CHAT domain-containing protein